MKIVKCFEKRYEVVSDKFNKKFSNIKIVFDAFCVVLAIILSMIFFDFKIVGVGVGTILAMSTGFFIKIFIKKFGKKV